MISFSQRDYEMTESELSLLKSVSLPQTILPFAIKSCVPCTYISTLKLKDSPFLQKIYMEFASTTKMLVLKVLVK